MAVAVTNYDKESRKWETTRSQGGMRPDAFQNYPLMLYKAKKKPEGGPFLCVDPYDESFSTNNQLIVGNPEEEERARNQGWKATPQEAIAHAKALEDEIAFAAAERQTADRLLSEKARAEAKAVDDATFEHVAEIPESPIKRSPGRPRKAVQPAE